MFCSFIFIQISKIICPGLAIADVKIQKPTFIHIFMHVSGFFIRSHTYISWRVQQEALKT